jgi:hypothetical protein
VEAAKPIATATLMTDNKDLRRMRITLDWQD